MAREGRERGGLTDLMVNCSRAWAPRVSRCCRPHTLDRLSFRKRWADSTLDAGPLGSAPLVSFRPGSCEGSRHERRNLQKGTTASTYIF